LKYTLDKRIVKYYIGVNANIQNSALDIFEVLAGASQIWNGNIVN